MFLRQIFDSHLAQYAYLVGCQQSGEALIIDPQRDIKRYQKIAKQNKLHITAVAETHIHADFVSGAQGFAKDPNVHLYLSGEGGEDWSYRWASERPHTHFLRHGDVFRIGKIHIETLHTPGHTPEHVSYLLRDGGADADEPIALVSGDFIFVGDVGRPDLLESASGHVGTAQGAARRLRKSLVERLKGRKEFLQILPGHGAGSACGKSLGSVPTTTWGYEQRFNSALKLAHADEEAFVKNILKDQPDPPAYFTTMKKINRDGVQEISDVPALPHLNPERFREFAQHSTRILDTRGDRHAFAAGHIKGSFHTPLHSSLFSNAAGSFLSEKDSIRLVVENDEDAELAAIQLYRIGFDHVAGWITAPEARDAGLFTEQLETTDFSSFDAAKAAKKGSIIDVRTSAEFNKGHLPSALNFPFTRLKTRVNELPKKRPLFVHCQSGARAALASSFLQAGGHQVVFVDGEYPGKT